MTIHGDTLEETEQMLRDRLRELRQRIGLLREQRDGWKQRALTCEQDRGIMLPGRWVWPVQAERWRSPIHYWLSWYGGDMYQHDEGMILDMMVGIVWFESSGNPYAVSGVEWIGEPPPGYDGTAETRASGLFQHIPAYWGARSQAAGHPGMSIFDPNINIAVACYLLFADWPEDRPAPHFHHWSGAHVGVRGSLEKVREIVDPLYADDQEGQ